MKREATRILERLFAMIPVLHANPGIRMEDLLRVTGFRDLRELRRNLDRLMMFGRPPFAPGDFIDVYIDDSDRVFLEFPHGMEHPLELTTREWSVVRRAISRALEFRPVGDQDHAALADVLKKLSTASVEYRSADFYRSRRLPIDEALEDSLQIEFSYTTPSSREPEIRRLDPWVVFQHRGGAYVIGYDHSRLGARSFHLDRMENVEILDVPQSGERPDNLSAFLDASPIFRPGRSGTTVRLKFRGALRAALEYTFHIRDTEPLADEPSGDWWTGSCKVASSLWFRESVRSFGPEVEVLEPGFLRRELAADLRDFPIPEAI